MPIFTDHSDPSKRFRRVLIANRGEIALRIIRTLRELNIESVALYSDADADSAHRQFADFAIRLPGRSSADTYLRQDKILQALGDSKADALHPGYGFLSENQDFARSVHSAGVQFIGPTAEAMSQLGDKISAKSLMRQVGVPTVPGSEGALGSLEELQSLAQTIGYPMILKASGGGGGRGMRIVRKDADLAEAYKSCRREGQLYFGNDTIFCERYIDQPRHIEVQVLFDHHGNGIHLFERDCSLQRRHQKVLEEAPSQYLNADQRAQLGALAIKAGAAAGYRGVGTVEFICESPDRAYFMEMNTRIQVEHPVTEMITGIDLIRWQILVAMGHKLPVEQNDIQLNGWSFEARINAEIPEKDFMPSSGTIRSLQVPGGPFVRFDSHIYSGYTPPGDYDSMIAKLIVWGNNREEARLRLDRALRELKIEGLWTNAAFHRRLLAHPEVIAAQFDTTWLERHGKELNQIDPEQQTEADGTKVSDRSPLALASLCGWQHKQRYAALVAPIGPSTPAALVDQGGDDA